MKDEADKILSKMPELLDKLLSKKLLDQIPSLPREIQGKGIYVFYEYDKPLYVGRSNNLKIRIKDQMGKSRSKAAFAFILTRDEWSLWKNPIWERDLYKADKEPVEIRNSKGQQTKVKLSKGAMLHDKRIYKDFELQSERIKKMQVRIIEIEDEYEQAMFEIYAANVLDTPYNTFKTT